MYKNANQTVFFTEDHIKFYLKWKFLTLLGPSDSRHLNNHNLIRLNSIELILHNDTAMSTHLRFNSLCSFSLFWFCFLCLER